MYYIYSTTAGTSVTSQRLDQCVTFIQILFYKIEITDICIGIHICLFSYYFHYKMSLGIEPHVSDSPQSAIFVIIVQFICLIAL